MDLERISGASRKVSLGVYAIVREPEELVAENVESQ